MSHDIPEIVPEYLQRTYLVVRCAKRLHRLIELKAPAYIIETEKRLLQTRVANLPVYLADYVQFDKGELE